MTEKSSYFKSRKTKLILSLFSFSIIALFIYSFLNNSESTLNKPNNSLDTQESEVLTINMAEVPQVPWDTEEAAVHVLETFIAAVQGSLAPIYDFGSKDVSNQNTLLEKYFCDGKTCYATLKKGVLFHNNREVTAYDVEFSFVKQLLMKENGSYAFSILDDLVGIDNINKKNIKIIQVNSLEYPSQALKGIEVKDNYNIIFHLKRENKFFFQRASEGRIPIVPIEEFESDYTKWKKYPIGFGKYKVVNADLETHEFYLEKVSQEERIPKKIKLIFSKENIGDIKMLLGGPNRGNASYERQVIFQDVYSNGGFLYNYQTELGRNLNFRKAISLALDREKISEATVFKEMAPEDQMLPNSGWQKDYRFPMPIQKQNIAEAKRLLNLVPEHLWKNKVFQVPSYWEDVKEINTLPYISVIKKQLQDIGIAVEFLNTDMDYDKFKEGDTNVLWWTGFAFASSDPNKNFAYFRKGSYFSNEHPNDPEYEKLYQESVKNVNKSPEDTQKLSAYFTENNIMTVVLNQRMSLSYDSRKILSLGSQHNGIRLAIWEISLRE